MNIEFKLPELGENVDSGDIVKALVGEGDRIEANQGICELETDKGERRHGTPLSATGTQ